MFSGISRGFSSGFFFINYLYLSLGGIHDGLIEEFLEFLEAILEEFLVKFQEISQRNSKASREISMKLLERF